MRLLLILICCLWFTTVLAQRQTYDFTEDWKFHLGHTYDIEKDFGFGAGKALQFAKLEPAPYGGHGIPATLLKFDDSEWKSIQLPHDWTVDLPYDFSQHEYFGNRYGYKVVGREYPETSIGWYRKKFNIGKNDEGKRIVVEFEGVFRDCMVWVNGFYMGRHWSGYTGFAHDISDFLVYGKENIISVRVDATLHEGWFYEGSGINKELRLVKTNPLHIEDSGPYISTVITEAGAAVSVSSKVLNEGFEQKEIQVQSELVNSKGQVVAKQISNLINIDPRSEKILQQKLNMKKPQLWSAKSPNRYKLIAKVISDGKVIDNYETKIGIRSIEFRPDHGFFLNGERVQINGVCIHQNFAGVGSALPEALHYYRLKLLKEMGVNAVRSHYPFSKSMLNACDSLGMLVMDETRAAGSTSEALEQVKWMVSNHRNHPSIIIWSMANEEGGTQRDIIGRRYMKKMVAEAHKYDSTRLVTAGVNAWGNKVDFGFSQEIDVMGFNYSADFIEEYHKNHPKQAIVGTEVSNATVTRGFYEFSDNNKSVAVADGAGAYFIPEDDAIPGNIKGHIASNLEGNNRNAYKVQKFYAERKYLAGTFFWTGFDYNGEIWPSKAPNNSSQFGAMDLCGFPKAMYYYYKSWWTEEPVLHMAQHWNWKGMEGKETAVLIHTNCDEVKLLLNGKSLGKRSVESYGYLSWKVKYAPGKLEAIGYKNGKKVVREELVTAEKPAQLKLTSDKENLKANGKDVAVIRVEVLDEKGNFVPLANNQLKFEIEGNAQILGTGNGDPSSAEIDSESRRKAFNGKAVVFIQAGKKEGEIKLVVRSEKLQTQTIILKQKETR